MYEIEEILREGHDRGASDIHLAPGNPVMFRVDGDLMPVSSEGIQEEEIEELMEPILTGPQKKILKERGETDFACDVEECGRIRVNMFRQRGTYAVSIRILPSEIPDPKTLGIPEAVIRMTTKRSGLILVTGSTGNGKTATLASLIQEIARNQQKTIITLEETIEYLYGYERSMVIQREMGVDFFSYAQAMQSALRQDADVIFVGEMRDLSTISTVLSAAETGHLVLSTLHTSSAALAIDRIINAFQPSQQQQIRIQLSEALEGIVAKQLLPRLGGGRIAAYEVLPMLESVRSLIREGRDVQLTALMQEGKKKGLGTQTMDDAIYDLFMKSCISAGTAMDYAHHAAEMEEKIRLF